MSHHFERDLEYPAAALTSPAHYSGVLRPRARAKRLLVELAASAAAREIRTGNVVHRTHARES